jgi:hypothetical protein
MIDVDDAVDLIWKHFNPRCTNIDGSPHPWSMTDIKHKVRDAVRSTKHVYGHGVNKDWDVRWKCCPALASLVDRLERNEVVDWKLYAPGIEEHAQAAIKRRWVASKTTKKRVDRHWFSELEQFLQGCPHQELKADYILSTAFRIESPTNGQKTRLGRSMSAHGWSSKRTRVDGRLVQFYVAPGSSAR